MQGVSVTKKNPVFQWFQQSRRSCEYMHCLATILFALTIDIGVWHELQISDCWVAFFTAAYTGKCRSLFQITCYLACLKIVSVTFSAAYLIPEFLFFNFGSSHFLFCFFQFWTKVMDTELITFAYSLPESFAFIVVVVEKTLTELHTIEPMRFSKLCGTHLAQISQKHSLYAEKTPPHRRSFVSSIARLLILLTIHVTNGSWWPYGSFFLLHSYSAILKFLDPLIQVRNS